MPTINEYKNKDGYYIRAYISDADSPITYQVAEEAHPIIEDYGFSHEDEIAWDIIQSFNSIGLIYTGDSGISSSGDRFEPDPNVLDELLTEESSREFLEVIKQNQDLNSEELQDLRSILGIEEMPISEEVELSVPLSSQEVQTVNIFQSLDTQYNFDRGQLAILVKTKGVLDEHEEALDLDATKKIELTTDIVSKICPTGIDD